MTADGRRPALEPIARPAELVQVPADLHPGLGRDVLRIRAHQGAEVAQQARLHSPVHNPESVLVTLLSGEHGGGEVIDWGHTHLAGRDGHRAELDWTVSDSCHR